MYEKIAGSCDDGTCPAIWRDPGTGQVLVQGYVTTDSPPGGVPVGETVVRIDPEAWARITAQL